MKKFVSWKQVEEFVDTIVSKYEDNNFNGVYGLPRGGLVLAVMISHRLNIPLLASATPGCLIVDDICDSGESLLHYVRNTSSEVKNIYTIATMFYKENKLGIKPDYFMQNKNNDWIVFPWEEKEPEGGLLCIM